MLFSSGHLAMFTTAVASGFIAGTAAVHLHTHRPHTTTMACKDCSTPTTLPLTGWKKQQREHSQNKTNIHFALQYTMYSAYATYNA